MKPRSLCTGLLLVAACSPALADTQRRQGDQLSLALPLGTLAVELARGDFSGAWQLGQTFALTTGSTEILKRITDVPRPDGSDRLSFPSGHAARAFSASAYVHVRHGWQAALPLHLAAAYVGHTRVQADRHRWADVAGAAALAFGFADWRVVPAGAQAWFSAANGGWQLGLSLPLH
jgi:membrane-associated phospholipid phosphatase